MKNFDIKHKWDDESLQKKDWTLRTQIVANMIEPNQSILDLGCGDKEILKFYNPKDYCGVDVRADADIQLDLREDFKLPNNWDFILCCGILEYIGNIENFFKKTLHLGDKFIITWLEFNLWNPIPEKDFEILLRKYFVILEKNKEYQIIYKCQKIK